MQEEGLAKALTVAAARKAKCDVKDLKDSDLEKIDWKDLNIDPALLRKLYNEQKLAVQGEARPPNSNKDQKDASKKEHTSVATQGIHIQTCPWGTMEPPP